MTGNIPALVAAFSTVIVLDRVMIPFMFTENIPGPGCSSVILLVKITMYGMENMESIQYCYLKQKKIHTIKLIYYTMSLSVTDTHHTQ